MQSVMAALMADATPAIVFVVCTPNSAASESFAPAVENRRSLAALA